MSKEAVKDKKETAKSKNRAEKKDPSVLHVSDFKDSKSIPYHKITITCACGAEYESGSTQESIRLDICAKCHPFFTGENRILDAEGRVEQFKKRYSRVAAPAVKK